MDRRVKKILELLRQDGSRRGLTSRGLAKRVNLSTSRMYYLFKAEMKTAPGRFAKNERIEAARRLLETTFLSVKEIAAQSGFDDQSHFARDFKKRYGLSPARHRERNFKG